MKFLLVFVLASFSVFSLLLGAFWEASGALWAPFGIVWGLFGVLVSPFWVPLARLGCFWSLLILFCDKGPQGGDSQPSFVFFLYVFFVLGVVFSCFSRCFLTRKRGRGGAAGAAEDHSSIQHSLETIALQPFFFLVVFSR